MLKKLDRVHILFFFVFFFVFSGVGINISVHSGFYNLFLVASFFFSGFLLVFLEWKWIGIFFVSTILLTATSPVIAILWTLLATVYFLLVGHYSLIFQCWGYVLGLWYCLFTMSFSDVTIMIGPGGYTGLMVHHLLTNRVFFETMCAQTIVILHLLSVKTGCVIWVPSMYNVLNILYHFIKNLIGGNNDSPPSS